MWNKVGKILAEINKKAIDFSYKQAVHFAKKSAKYTACLIKLNYALQLS